MCVFYEYVFVGYIYICIFLNLSTDRAWEEWHFISIIHKSYLDPGFRKLVKNHDFVEILGTSPQSNYWKGRTISG